MRQFLTVFATTALCVAHPRHAIAQRDTTKSPVRIQGGTPACCAVVRIDAQHAIVTARETATGFTFRFAPRRGVEAAAEPASRRLLGSLKIGQPVWADFTRKTVTLNATAAAPCCAIIETQEKQP